MQRCVVSPSRPPKTRVKFRVAFTREVPVGTIPEQETFFCVDRASLLRLVPLLLWDTDVNSVYVDDHEGEVLADLVRT